MMVKLNSYILIIVILSFLILTSSAISFKKHSDADATYFLDPIFHEWIEENPLLLTNTGLMVSQSPSGSCSACTKLVETVYDIFTQTNNNNPVKAIQHHCLRLATIQEEQKKCVQLGLHVFQILAPISQYKLSWSPETICGYMKQCAVNCCDTPFKPEQIVMLLGETQQERQFSWTTLQNATQYLTLSTDDKFVTKETYMASMFTYNSGGWEGYIHHVSITNLIPGQRYFYRMGIDTTGRDDADVVLSDIFSFVVPVTDIGFSKPLTAIIFGDMDMTERSLITRQWFEKHLDSLEPHVILLLGDLGYADGDESVWKDWMNYLQNTFTRRGTPLITIAGNHESPNWPSYLLRFPRRRANEPGVNNPIPYGSHSLGSLFIQTLNSESSWLPGVIDFDDEQVKWMQKNLATAPTPKQWKISSLHRPLYCSGSDRTCVAEGSFLRSKIENHLIKAGVDMIFYGHVHSYERTTATRDASVVPNQCTYFKQTTDSVQEVCQKGSPIYVMSGNPGNSHSPGHRDPKWQPFTSQTWFPQGIGVLRVVEDYMRYDYIDMEKDQPIDTLTIRRV